MWQDVVITQTNLKERGNDLEKHKQQIRVLSIIKVQPCSIRMICNIMAPCSVTFTIYPVIFMHISN